MVTTWVISVWAPALLAFLVAGSTFGIWKLPSRRFLRHAFDFGWRSHLGAVVQYMQHRADVVLILYFLPLRDLGIYSLVLLQARDFHWYRKLLLSWRRG